MTFGDPVSTFYTMSMFVFRCGYVNVSHYSVSPSDVVDHLFFKNVGAEYDRFIWACYITKIMLYFSVFTDINIWFADQ